MATTSKPTTVEMTLAAELVESSWGETGGVSLVFAYRTDMPLSVFVRVRGVDIEFARDLLRDAVTRTMAGAGDVKFINHGLTVYTHFETTGRYADYALDRGDVRAFLRATERACRFGAEVVDVDAVLAEILEDGAR